MNAIFAGGAKLLGVYLAFVGVQHIGIAVIVASEPRSAIVGNLLIGGAALGFAALLALRTDAVARTLRAEGTGDLGGGGRSLLRVGLILVGAYVVVTRGVWAAYRSATYLERPELWTRDLLLLAAVDLAPVLLAVGLIVFAGPLSERLDRRP